MSKLYYYKQREFHYSSHKWHPVQPGSIIFKVRSQGSSWAMYGDATNAANKKRILLSDNQVIPLSDHFKNIGAPSEYELSLFLMLFGVDISDALKSFQSSINRPEEGS